MPKEYLGTTSEEIHTLDEPKGVSWLTGYSLQMDGHPDYEQFQEHGTKCECCNRFGVFPVPTAELLGQKGMALAVGDIFKVKLNLDADTPADVMPEVLEYVPELTTEEIAELDNILNYEGK
jgi:hypothetical protein